MEEAVSRFTPHASAAKRQASRISFLTVIQDRLSLAQSNRARFIEACEQAYHFGKGKLAIRELPLTNEETFGVHHFSDRLHCAQCDIEYRDPSPALFSFNNPVGACPACRGFGRIISIDYSRALPDRSKTLAGGVVKPWQSGHGLESQNDLLRMCRHFGIPTDVPFNKLPQKWKNFVIEGDPDYRKDQEHEWPRAWYGVKGYFRWLESKAYKMHVRVLLSRYRAYTPCPECKGKRFQPEALLYRVRKSNDSGMPSLEAELQAKKPIVTGQPPTSSSDELTLADFYELPVRDALHFIETLKQRSRLRPNDPVGLVLNEVVSRLAYLDQVGLGYLTLDRPTRSLSGGETERVNLTSCLGTCLVNTLFVLDEPRVGLHARDTERLVRILEKLRDIGNTVVVVEHEASVMRAADHILDLGPGHGASGGQLVFQGSFSQLLKSKNSLTGQYLSGRKMVEVPQKRYVSASAPAQRLGYLSSRQSSNPLALNDTACSPQTNQEATSWLRLSRASLHNLQNLTVDIPLNRFVCITGVSGSGKTTLVREVLLPALTEKLKSYQSDARASARLDAETNGDNEE